MLSEFFASPSRIRAICSGPFGPRIEEFANHLYQSGYAKITARRHIRTAEHVVHWAIHRGLSIGEFGDDVLKLFEAHLSRCRCGRFARCPESRMETLAGARLFVEHLRGVHSPTIRVTTPVDPAPELLKAFCRWMREQRGTTDPTLYNYGIAIRKLIQRFGEDPVKLDARGLRRFVLEHSESTGWATAKRCTTALRMFLRFLIAEGRCPAGLLGAIPTLAHWRLSSLPRYFPSADVERLISSCNRFVPVGKRDRAILLLLARLGLRAGDIVQMRLQDIDWKDATISVSGKSRRQTRLPLSQEVGKAIVEYLLDGRPAARTDALFLRSRAPYQGLGSHCAVSMIVARAIRRTGIKRPSRGAAHLLRHSLASSMLRQGASLLRIPVNVTADSGNVTGIPANVTEGRCCAF